MFHSGVFTWLGVYLERRYRLDSVGIGLALLAYGVPGFLFGPLIGRAADRLGRGCLLPVGLAVSTLAVAALLLPFPLFLAPAVALVLSLGYDMTQPHLAGIVTGLGGQRPGQAMGLNVFMLFVGFGLGSLASAALLRSGFGAALGTFAAVELIAMLYSVRAFRSEIPSRALGNAAHPYP